MGEATQLMSICYLSVSQCPKTAKNHAPYKLLLTKVSLGNFCCELWNFILLQVASLLSLLMGLPVFAIATAIVMTNLMHNVLNQFNTRTTLHRHYKYGILASIKMMHSLSQSYTTNNPQQSPLLQNMKQNTETVSLMLEIDCIKFITSYYGKYLLHYTSCF